MVLFFVPRIVFGNVVINEVLYDAEGTDTGKEYIILYNNSDSAVDLANYELNAVSGDYYVLPSFSLNSKSSIIIHWRNEGTNSQTNLYTGTTGFDANMGDTSGWVALFKSHPTTGTAKDLIVDYIEYGAGAKTWEKAASDAGIWTVGAFVSGVSAPGKAIKLKTDGMDTNSPNDWIESVPSITQEESSSSSEESTTETSKSQSSVANNPPVPQAGSDIVAFVGQEIKFDGSESTDPDNDELAYFWNMGDGKLVERPTFTYQYLYPGTYVVALMVYDGRYYATDTATIKIQAAQITINEFMPNPEGKDEEEEWIEIYNDSETTTDISGWQIDDADGGSAPFTFPQNTLIAPKSYLVFPRQITNIALNNDKDSVRLLLPGGVIFEEINYENPQQGRTSAKTSEGFVWSLPTPGTANLSLIISTENKQVIYQGSPKTETTKNPSMDLAVLYNVPAQEIQGGYTEIAPNSENPQKTNQLAEAKQSLSQNISNNLLYIIAIIVLVGLVIGILLVKLRKKRIGLLQE